RRADGSCKSPEVGRRRREGRTGATGLSIPEALASVQRLDADTAELELSGFRVPAGVALGSRLERLLARLCVALVQSRGGAVECDAAHLHRLTIQFGLGLAVLDRQLQDVFLGKRLAVDSGGNDAPLDGDVQLVPAAVVELDLGVRPGAGIIAHLELWAANKQ